MISKLPETALEIIKIFSSLDGRQLDGAEIASHLNHTPVHHIRYALRRLRENGLIYTTPKLDDMRSVNYRLAHPAEILNSLNNLSNETLLEVLEKLSLNYSKNEIIRMLEKNS